MMPANFTPSSTGEWHDVEGARRGDFYRNFYRTGRNGLVVHSMVQHVDSLKDLFSSTFRNR
jgi:hypothetical protein